MPIRLVVLAVLTQGALIVAAQPAAAAAPQTTIVSGPSGLIASRSATFSFKSSLRSSTFQCMIDAKAWGSCTSPKRYSTLSQGAHTFRVRARKNGTVDRTPAVRSFTVDTAKPQTTITEAPPERIIHWPFPYQFAASEAGTFECRLDNAPFAPCASPFRPEVMPDRIHTFQVRARDVAGNADATPASHQFSIVSVLSFSQETGEAVAEYFIPDQVTMDIPANCGGSPQIDCPGGNPAPPADQLSIGSTRSVVKVNGSQRYDVTVTMDVETLQSFTVNSSGIECQVTLNSANGTTPTWSLAMQMSLVTHATFGERYLLASNQSVTGVEDEDYELSGGFICSFANVYPPSTLASTFADLIADRMPPICMAPGPALFETCPWALV